MDRQTEDVVILIRLLKAGGLEHAQEVVWDELVPLAKESHISIYQAVRNHADDDEEQDTSWYQMWLALTKISREEIESLDIHKPL